MVQHKTETEWMEPFTTHIGSFVFSFFTMTRTFTSLTNIIALYIAGQSSMTDKCGMHAIFDVRNIYLPRKHKQTKYHPCHSKSTRLSPSHVQTVTHLQFVDKPWNTKCNSLTTYSKYIR